MQAPSYENLPIGYIVQDDLLKAYAKKCGLPEIPRINILMDALHPLRRKVAPAGSPIARGTAPLWTTDFTGDAYYSKFLVGKVVREVLTGGLRRRLRRHIVRSSG
jgi:hypothetical protein